MTIDQLTSYAFAEPEPSHFEAIPGFIDYLTYIEQDFELVKNEEGKKIKQLLFNEDGTPIYCRKRFKPVHKDIYRVMKKLAGESVCMRTEKYIARMVGCSTHTIAEAKEVLQNAVEQMDGLSLISIDEQRCLTTREDENGESKKVNKRSVHITHINSLWRYNKPFMKNIYSMHMSDERRLPPKMKEIISFKEAEIAVERMNQDSVQDIVRKSIAERKNAFSPKVERKNAFSPQGEKEGRTQKCVRHKHPSTIPFVLKQDPAERAIQMSLINQKNVDECFASQHKATEFLEILGLKISVISGLFAIYSLHDMLSSIYYLKDKLSKNKTIESLTGYYLLILQKRWHIPTPS